MGRTRTEVQDTPAEALRVWPSSAVALMLGAVGGLTTDLAVEAIHRARQLAAALDHPEVAGLLTLMLLHHARRAARTALHADARRAEETDWAQIVEWYDELVRLTDSPVVRLNRAVTVGEADGPPASAANARRPHDRAGQRRGAQGASGVGSRARAASWRASGVRRAYSAWAVV
ncbi:hypothetical protein GCM10009801_70310 [Streptomyces albiaxialis]|uniref:DUF6596 domain-containing protein n=1 Tax=Streptomyces albiaxialis TaxID=329523 RepID=A0ABN2WWX5_9ACTN